MDFAERFKGKTNKLTRDGIISTLTKDSVPIDKTQPPISKKETPKKKIISKKLILPKPQKNRNESKDPKSDKAQDDKILDLPSPTNEVKNLSKSYNNLNPSSDKSPLLNNKKSFKKSNTSLKPSKANKVPDSSIYSTPEFTNHSKSAYNLPKYQANPFLAFQGKQTLSYSTQLNDMLIPKKSQTPVVLMKPENNLAQNNSQRRLRIQSFDHVNHNDHMNYLKQNYFGHNAPQSTTADHSPVFNFMDRQEKMYAKYRFSGMVNQEADRLRPNFIMSDGEFTPNGRNQKLVGFNYY